MGHRVAIISDDRYLEHDTGHHPECPQRIEVICDALRTELGDGLTWLSPRQASEEDLLRVHVRDHVNRVREMCECGGGFLDLDTPCCGKSFETSLLAAGAGLSAVDALAEGMADRAFAVVRPPGHHASRNRSAGFCLFNNVAICAEYGRARWRWRRVAIIDWDVHHGNGTEAIFADDGDVCYASMHQWPHYPGTGGPGGDFAGKALRLNFPLPHGTGGQTYLSLLDSRVRPTLRDFKPDVILASVGFDAGEEDPLAGMCLTASDFESISSRVALMADEFCQGRLICMLEGGYSLSALGSYAVAHVRGLC